MAQSDPEKDRFELQLDVMIEKLQACQAEHGVKSCSACEHCLGCDVRKSYVAAVYDSMSKGETGGFEF
ncbi:hypothetical protein LOH54_06625 [Sulfurimonas sp. HSL-3221]|uniref:hypothetical protein n=1 Tax=Thiomicrolovo TaxID=3451667 RepID=UPI001E50B6B0|nr:hypothetical protein [Sulfurimonas sp. HSL-3221]UFS61335.1 hypothetical protein LOH54_06625 [Sulfurimonas sp. HSL-3221]